MLRNEPQKGHYEQLESATVGYISKPAHTNEAVLNGGGGRSPLFTTSAPCRGAPSLAAASMAKERLVSFRASTPAGSRGSALSGRCLPLSEAPSTSRWVFRAASLPLQCDEIHEHEINLCEQSSRNGPGSTSSWLTCSTHQASQCKSCLRTPV